MKLLFKFLLVAAVVEFSSAREFDRNSFKQNYKLHREPLFEPAIEFNDGEIVREKWIEQRLDNFDALDERTWQMRYLENNFFLRDGGPIFVFVGGEWEISAGWLLNSHFRDMARELNGTLFYTEHRYYGQSHPTKNLSRENLRFLNADQALADLAHFIVHIKQTIREVRNSGVILVGASYSASLVTWFMQKYPHLANGAWASSAPLEAIVEFAEFKEVVSRSIEVVGGENCSNRIRNAFAELESLIEEGNARRVEEVFHLCHPLNITNDLDVSAFISELAEGWTAIVQSHRERYQNIQTECDILLDERFENDVEALSHWWWFGVIEPIEPVDYCYDHRYNVWLYFWGNINWDGIGAQSNMRQWMFQSCSEYGWFQSSASDEILFGSSVPLNMSLSLCRDLYGESFTPERVHRLVDRTNVIYGARRPNSRNVYSTHGDLDPWAAVGTLDDINETSPTVILPMESHCADLGPISDQDTPEMRASKERILELVRQWLGLNSSSA